MRQGLGLAGRPGNHSCGSSPAECRRGANRSGVRLFKRQTVAFPARPGSICHYPQERRATAGCRILPLDRQAERDMDAGLMTGVMKRRMQNLTNEPRMSMKTKHGCGELRGVALTFRSAPQVLLAATFRSDDGNADLKVGAANLNERTENVIENKGCQF